MLINYIMKLISFDIGIKNMAYCIASINQDNLEIIKLNKIDLEINNKATTQTIIDITIEFLNNIFHNEIIMNNDECLKVLIECQMTSKMRCIQTTINTFFKMISKFEGLDIETINLSAKHKLDLTKKYPEFSNTDDKSNYRNNKINAISFANYLLNSKYFNNDILEIIKKEKKKDDICDALLMIYYYYEK
jgi:hypothetical protein